MYTPTGRAPPLSDARGGALRPHPRISDNNATIIPLGERFCCFMLASALALTSFRPTKTGDDRVLPVSYLDRFIGNMLS